VKGSFIVASAIFASLVIIVIVFKVLISQTLNVEIGLVLGSLLVLIYAKPTIEEYVSQDASEERGPQT